MNKKLMQVYLKDLNAGTNSKSVGKYTKALDFWLLCLMGITLAIYLLLNGYVNLVSHWR